MCLGECLQGQMCAFLHTLPVLGLYSVFLLTVFMGPMRFGDNGGDSRHAMGVPRTKP